MVEFENLGKYTSPKRIFGKIYKSQRNFWDPDVARVDNFTPTTVGG